jgi:hypothetical protein
MPVSEQLKIDLKESFEFEGALQDGQRPGNLSLQQRAYWRVGVAELWATGGRVRSSSILRERITRGGALCVESVLSTWEYRRNEELQGVRDRLAVLQEMFSVDYKLFEALGGPR